MWLEECEITSTTEKTSYVLGRELYLWQTIITVWLLVITCVPVSDAPQLQYIGNICGNPKLKIHGS